MGRSCRLTADLTAKGFTGSRLRAAERAGTSSRSSSRRRRLVMTSCWWTRPTRRLLHLRRLAVRRVGSGSAAGRSRTPHRAGHRGHQGHAHRPTPVRVQPLADRRGAEGVSRVVHLEESARLVGPLTQGMHDEGRPSVSLRGVERLGWKTMPMRRGWSFRARSGGRITPGVGIPFLSPTRDPVPALP